MNLLSDLKTLYSLTLRPIRGDTHAERLEHFYSGQAATYDDFRKQFLRGRRELYSTIAKQSHGVWVDMGGGTGANLEHIGTSFRSFDKVFIVDLSDSMLTVARQRIARHGWTNAETVNADVTSFQPDTKMADVVTFSYSLTMMPDWFAAIDNAWKILKPGGLIGVVDFYVSRKHSGEYSLQHNWFNRSFWPLWFASDNVFPSSDHLPYLQTRFQRISLSESRLSIPYLPILRIPYYSFIGKKVISS